MANGHNDTMGLSEHDTILPIVPMFHANAWGLLHAAPMLGAKIVLPGRFMDPGRMVHLLAQERGTFAAGVPTIWIGVLAMLEKEQADLSALPMIICGGSAIPQSLIEGRARENLNYGQDWRVTETAPL